MAKKKLDIEIENYLNDNWPQIVEDIRSVIRIPSSKNDGEVNKEYPSGTGAYKAMRQSLKIANKMGFKTKNHKNVIGIADLKGESKTQIGFIGHVDVVAPGEGWHFNPYDLSLRNGYMIGRGIVDDKGPTIILLHAINFWLQKNKTFPYSIRYLFGTDEETLSNDVTTFLKDFEEPKFLLLPDADFPVPYGEKGIMRFDVKQKVGKSQIISMQAGVSVNAVTGIAKAIVNKNIKNLDAKGSELEHAIKISRLENGNFEIIATGRSAHAAEPHKGIDSIAILIKFLLEKNIGNDGQIKFFKFIDKIGGKPYGEGVNIDSSDKHFGSLTIVPTNLTYKNGIIQQVFDCRFPTSINAKTIYKQIKKHMPKAAELIEYKSFDPYIINPKSKLINTLAKSYVEATGEKATLFTMSGSTYSRRFRCATSFGPLRSWIANPAWIGEIHGPDEGISEKELKLSFNVYVYTIKNLMKLNFDDDKFIEETLTIK